MLHRRVLLPAFLALAVALLLLVPRSLPGVDEDADPFLWIREPAVELLRSCEVLDKPYPDPLLPSEEEGGNVWFGPDGETWDGIVHLRREPVYSSLSEREGTRLTIVQEVAEHVRGVRIAVGLGEDPKLGAIGERIGRAEVPGYALWRVQAFVPEAEAWHWCVVAEADDGRRGAVMWLGVTRPAALAPDLAHVPAGNKAHRGD